MFTGIIQAVGRLAGMDSTGGDSRLTIETGLLPLNDAKLGDSIAVNGVCLTAVALGAQYFAADVSRETLSCTTLGEWKPGQAVNLELALTPSTRLGGHIVSGHVDGVGEVLTRSSDARSVRFVLAAPASLARYLAAKGSICVDGVSLTVNGVNGNRFELNIVPHTLAETTLAALLPGQRVNLEVDLLARYLERLVLGEQAAIPKSGITESLLAEAGFKE
ncbi:riboflavin synthase [Candidatus Methylospira mobilis]|uniref:Riboflavin synthase n=1 Tax=Candidatus Methylospira mobilis TaxID=1808979 RepID=A0A5Q0BMJ2_9GAMM|nr:riboflavin synthase [Candidatus Methylospira mobilis]QFY43338.1 riboflavin synthase [Candidatus Methylospira mobilis]WNV03445.1 riboflavin synthase [Candidatus Methylospira mobilis]